MNLQPVLEGELVSLRPLKEEDREPLYQIAKDPFIWEQHPASDRFQRKVFLDFFEESIKSCGALIIKENATDQIIGSSRFKRIENSTRAVEIGWSFLSKDKWGGKYNRAFKSLMIDYALEHIDHIIFYIGLKNVRSQRAVEKLGGQRIEDKSLRYLVQQGTDDLTYRIGALEWQEVKARVER